MSEQLLLPPPPEDGRYRVLVVEDDPFIARLILSNLSKANLHCRTAEDGILGMIEFKEFQPHIVLSDIMMPGMDGRQLCSTLREISMVPIILITAADTSVAELAAFKAGADDYISKPFDPQSLLTRVIVNLRRVYRYDAQAHATTESAAPKTEPKAVFRMICKSCGHSGPQAIFQRENSRSQRLLVCPNCGETENFVYPKTGVTHGQR